jgi:excisionase family DNA binding protein
MKNTWLTVDELAAVLKVSVKSIRRAYRKGQIPVERICRFVRFDLDRVKAAMQGNGKGQSPFASREQGQRSAQPAALAGGARSGPAPDLVRRGRLSLRRQGGRNDRCWRIHPDHRLARLHAAQSRRSRM